MRRFLVIASVVVAALAPAATASAGFALDVDVREECGPNQTQPVCVQGRKVCIKIDGHSGCYDLGGDIAHAEPTSAETNAGGCGDLPVCVWLEGTKVCVSVGGTWACWD